MDETTYPKENGYYWYNDERLKEDHWILCKVTMNKFHGFDVEFINSDYDTKGYNELTEEELNKLYPIYCGPIGDGFNIDLSKDSIGEVLKLSNHDFTEIWFYVKNLIEIHTSHGKIIREIMKKYRGTNLLGAFHVYGWMGHIITKGALR